MSSDTATSAQDSSLEPGEQFLGRGLLKAISKCLPRRFTDLFFTLFRPGEVIVIRKKYMSYNQDGLLTSHRADFMDDPRFLEAYREGERTNSWGGQPVHWRAYVALWVANKVKDLEGDFVECGVNRAGLAAAIVRHLGFQNLPKRFFLVDTFSGLVADLVTDEEKSKGIMEHYSHYDECYTAVQQTFADTPNVVLVRGIVPDVLAEVAAEKVCYLSLDMNCAAPEVAAADYFWDRMVSGAVIVSDDYAWRRHEAQKRALDDFAQRHGVEVLCLPTGQGLIFKP